MNRFLINFNSPIVYLCLASMFLSLMMLCYNKGYRFANRFLAGFFFFSSLFFLTLFEFLFSHNLKIIAVFETVIPSFYFLICPFAYFYIRSILSDNPRLSKLDSVHFIIFAIAFLGTMPFLFSSWEYKLQIAENVQSNYLLNPNYRLNFIFNPHQSKILMASQIIVYTVLNWYTLKKYSSQLRQRTIQTLQYNIIHKWLVILCVFFTLEAVFISLSVYNVVIVESSELYLHVYRHNFLLSSFSFLALNLALLLFPQILYGLPFEKVVVNPEMEVIDTANIRLQQQPEHQEKILSAFYSEEYLAKIELALKKVQNDQLFLNHDFKLEHISKISGIPLHHLAYYFANIYGIRFSEWRNNLRIEYATILIRKGEAKNITLNAISLKCGFASQNTFIRAFKNVTDTTPSLFIKSSFLASSI